MHSRQPKRPAASSRHGSSWFSRVHQRRHARHQAQSSQAQEQRREQDREQEQEQEQAPLLRDEHPDEASETETYRSAELEQTGPPSPCERNLHLEHHRELEEAEEIDHPWERRLSQATGLVQTAGSAVAETVERRLSVIAEIVQTTGSAIADTVERRFSVVAEAAQTAGSAVSNTVVSSASGTKTKMSRVFIYSRQRWKSIVVVLLGLFVIVAIVESLYVLVHHLPASRGPLVCTSPECVLAADRILSNLHPLVLESHALSLSINSCEDFNQFVCGGFQKRYETRGDRLPVSTVALMEDNVRVQLRDILREDRSGIPAKDRVIFGRVQDAYAACLNETSSRSRGLEPLRKVTNAMKGSFTAKHHSLQRPVSLQTTIGQVVVPYLSSPVLHAMQLGVNVLLDITVQIDDKKPDSHVVVIEPARPIGLPAKEYYANVSLLEQYEKVLRTTLAPFYNENRNQSRLLYQDAKPLNVDDLSHGVVAFERDLASLLPDEASLRNITKTYNKLTFPSLQRLLPQIDFDYVVKELSPGFEAGSLAVASPQFLRELSELLSQTPVPVIEAYFVRRVVSQYSHTVIDDRLMPLQRFERKFDDPAVLGRKWATCVDSVVADLGWILSKFYVERHYSYHMGSLAASITTSITEGHRAMIDDATWMFGQDQDQVRHKFDATSPTIGFPVMLPDLTDSSALEKLYSNVSVHSDTYLENKASAVQARVRRRWAQLDDSLSAEFWTTFATRVKPSFNYHNNEVTIPAGLLHEPILASDSLPSYLNYGAFGFVVAREISHALDPKGSRFDADGNFTDPWSSLTREIYDAKTTCLRRQFGQYKIQAPHGYVEVNGDLTLRENFNDGLGARAAYVSWQKDGKENALLPGLENFSPEQMFWLSFGNSMCSVMTKEAALQRVLSGTMPPGNIRIEGITADSREFLNAFDCPPRNPVYELR